MALKSLTPLDGRYESKVNDLTNYFSEYALMRYRVMVEIEYLLALSKTLKFKVPSSIRSIYENFSEKDAQQIKKIEKKTNHDVKAVEYFIKQKFKNKKNEFIHFALTSEDVNNLSYSLMLRDGVEAVVYPLLALLLDELKTLSKTHRSLPMLARTHGQPASPTTLGKEFAIYFSRLKKQVELLSQIRICGKLNGASGNFNAHHAAYPTINWIKFSKDFVASLGLEPNQITYQIEPHDRIAEIFHCLSRINNIIINLDLDMWTYISQDYLGQKVVKGEVGSSAMPHKVNPIDFENSEGNLGLGNSILEHLARKLPITRLQRDLTDSTVIRNQGTAIGYVVIGIKSTLKGLSKIKPNESKIKQDLDSHTEVIAEGIQTILRREGQSMPYEKLKELTRGKKVTLQDIHKFIDSLKIHGMLKKELKDLTPQNYVGKAKELTDIALKFK
jgi:adenylosuccinate lyase